MRRSMLRTLALVLATLIGIVILTAGYIVGKGVDAREEPGRLEAMTTRTLRDIAIQARVRGLANPVPVTREAIDEGMEHFADHCAVCHGNDGGGNTEMGRNLYPRAPDMRLAATQDLSDAELFYIIENGVRLTGMPGWATGTREGETASWHLVHFIRHLPTLSDEDIARMESLNPKSLQQVRQQLEEEKFLQGGPQ